MQSTYLNTLGSCDAYLSSAVAGPPYVFRKHHRPYINTITTKTPIMAQNLGVQPDFAAAAQSMHAAAVEIEKCGNLPAISEGATIINSIQALSAQIQAQIQASEARLSAQIQILSARVLATYVIDLLHLFNT